MTWLSGLESATRDEVLALRPEAAHRMSELEAALGVDDRLEASIIEVVRVRVAQLLGLTAARLDSAAELSARQSAALDFAEQYVMDPSGITDEQTADLNTIFSEPELTALTFTVAVYDAVGRADLVLDTAELEASR